SKPHCRIRLTSSSPGSSNAADSASGTRWLRPVIGRSGHQEIELSRLPMLHQEETIRRYAVLCQRLGELARWLVEQLVGQAKSPPMHGHRVARMQILLRAHCFLGIGMHYAHEPAWLVGADWQHRQVDGAEALADVGQVGRVTEVAAEEKTQSRMFDDPGSP